MAVCRVLSDKLVGATSSKRFTIANITDAIKQINGNVNANY